MNIGRFSTAPSPKGVHNEERFVRSALVASSPDVEVVEQAQQGLTGHTLNPGK
jgi:hypothetical protein